MLPPHLCRLDIRGALIIRLCQHAHHANQYLLHTLNRRPSLARMLVMVRIVARWMQDTDAYHSAGIDIGVPNFAEEPHRGWRERVVFWEAELGGEDPTFEGCAFGALDQGFPVQ